ncbi:MAG TPA: glycosyltransferase [Candidatus Acidoferrales bacterium]|nr:glycosyltransferase [Candidatus Acidoferrales bacterium]
MRILKTVQAYYPFQEKGGPVVKVRAIALGLSRRGHDVTVLTADFGFKPSLAPAMKAEKCRWGWCAEEQDVQAIFLRSRMRYRALTLNPDVIKYCSASLAKYDVVHIYGLYDLFGPPVAFFCRRYHVPYVVEPMGMFRPIVRNFRAKKLYHAVLGNRLLRGARRVIATSEQEKQELVTGGINPVRIVVRRNGIDIPVSLPPAGAFREKWAISPQVRIVLFLGRLVPKKSPDLLLEAFALWRRETLHTADSVLVFAGPEESDAYLARLKSLAAASGIADNVLFTGPLYDDAKWAAYRDADVFVLPSQNENFGNSAAEAMACGTPVILTDQCGIAPIVDGRTGLVVPHDSRAIATALKLLLDGGSLAGQFRDACPGVVRGLSWEQPLSQMEAIYRDVIAEVPAS